MAASAIRPRRRGESSALISIIVRAAQASAVLVLLSALSDTFRCFALVQQQPPTTATSARVTTMSSIRARRSRRRFTARAHIGFGRPLGSRSDCVTLLQLSARPIVGEGESLAGNDADVSPLAYTEWDVALNIGREESTRMPKTWGASGHRLLLKLRIQFRTAPLYVGRRFYDEMESAEDFLGGSHEEAQNCHVVGREAILGPSLTERGRKVFVGDGGWRVARGAGQNGEDELRFFIDLWDGIEREDVYCPAGRIYCACGYFENHRRRTGNAQLRLETLESKYSALIDEANKEPSPSLKRMSLWMDMLQCQMDLDRTRRELLDLHFLKSNLSQPNLGAKRDFGLTQYGGVSCKTRSGPFGLGSEYYILGKMELRPVRDQGETLQ